MKSYIFKYKLSYPAFSGIIELYDFVSSGTCESNGMKSIENESDCVDAAAQAEKQHSGIKVHQDAYGTGRPTGCSWHDHGNLELWSSSSGECDVNGYAGCFCKKLRTNAAGYSKDDISFIHDLI